MEKHPSFSHAKKQATRTGKEQEQKKKQRTKLDPKNSSLFLIEFQALSYSQGWLRTPVIEKNIAKITNFKVKSDQKTGCEVIFAENDI